LFCRFNHQHHHYLSTGTTCERLFTGCDPNGLLITEINDDLSKNYTAVKNEFVQKAIAESVTATNIYWHFAVDSCPKKNAGEIIENGNGNRS
jgi:hypothetical protein